MNKYLEKLAATEPGLLGKAVYFGQSLLGTRRDKAINLANSLAEAQVRKLTPQTAQAIADKEAYETSKARVKAGLGLAGVTTGGFLGVHKYHQHQDQKILDKLHQMGQTSYSAY